MAKLTTVILTQGIVPTNVEKSPKEDARSVKNYLSLKPIIKNIARQNVETKKKSDITEKSTTRIIEKWS